MPKNLFCSNPCTNGQGLVQTSAEVSTHPTDIDVPPTLRKIPFSVLEMCQLIRQTAYTCP